MGKKRDHNGMCYMNADTFELQNWMTFKRALVLNSDKLLRSQWKRSKASTRTRLMRKQEGVEEKEGM